MSAPPRHATKRNPGRRTLGPAIAMVAEALGKPLLPWQQLVADVATELDERGRYVYDTVVITVPRQSGKTTLMGAVQLHRVMTTPGVRCFYTAQTGKDARKRFQDLVNLVVASPLRAVAKPRWSAGDEGISFPNGSALKLFAPTRDALHGETPPMVTFDEIWAYDEPLGDAMLEGAVKPAQQNLTGRAQTWMVSTAGTALSTFMRKWVDRGKEAVRDPMGEWGKVAYFDWSLADGADPWSAADIAAFHPAVGELVGGDEPLTAEDLLALKLPRAEHLRALCNIWTDAADPMFSADEIRAVTREPEQLPAPRDLAMSYEIAPDNAGGIVMLNWRDADGVPVSRVLHSAPGTAWMHDEIVRWYRAIRPRVLGGDDGGPVRWLHPQLQRSLGDDALTLVGGKDFGTACVQWVTMLREANLKIDDRHVWRAGLGHLVMTNAGDVTRFSRARSTGPIVAPVASAVGIWLLDSATVVPADLVISY